MFVLSIWKLVPVSNSVMLVTYLLMIPFLSSSAGGCQLMCSVLESRAVARRSSGGAVGAAEYSKLTVCSSDMNTTMLLE